MDSKWIIKSAKTVGKGHLKENVLAKCEDSVLTKEENGVISLALSDGCGSSPLSYYGSNITTKVLCDMLTNDFDNLYDTNDLELKKIIVNSIISEINNFINENSELISNTKEENYKHYDSFYRSWSKNNELLKYYNLTLFNATAGFVAIKGSRALIGRLGDGIIGSVKGKTLSILSTEDKGSENKNATYYPQTLLIFDSLNKNEIWSNFEIIKINDISNYNTFFITSDGLEDVLIGNDDLVKFIYADEFNNIINTNNLYNLLENTYKNYKGIYDDLSIVLAKKDNVKVDSIILREYDVNGRTISNNKVISLENEEEIINVDYSYMHINNDYIIKLLDNDYDMNILDNLVKDNSKREFIINNIDIILNNISDEILLSDLVKNISGIDLLDIKLTLEYMFKLNMISKLNVYCGE